MEFSEQEAHKPIPYENLHKRALGRQETEIKKWTEGSFDDFLTDTRYHSPEALVAFFADHPDQKASQIVDSLKPDQYAIITEKIFENNLHIPKDQLANELQRVADQVNYMRESLIKKTNQMQLNFDLAVAHQLGYQPNEVRDDVVQFVASWDVYEVITTGISSREKKKTQPGYEPLGYSLGANTTPMLKEPTDSDRSLLRAALIPLSYGVEVNDGQLRLTSEARQEAPVRSDWYKQSIKSYTHESEHARVHVEYKNSDKRIHAGFRTYSPEGSEPATQQLVVDKAHDEGMTEFMSVWNMLLSEGTISITSTEEEIVNAIDLQHTRFESYTREVGNLIRDIKQKKAEYEKIDLKHGSKTNVLPLVLTSYFGSHGYPLSSTSTMK